MKSIFLGIVVAVISLIAVLVFYQTVYLLHQDVAAIALTGALAAELGSAFSELNSYVPPVEKLWYSLVHLISRASGIGSVAVIVLMTYAVTLFSVSLAFVIRQRTTGAGLAFFAIPLVAFLVLPIICKNIFGLREHFAMLGIWPYLVLRCAGAQAQRIGPMLRIIVGLWLGFMLLFKFVYSVVVLFVEVADAIANRRFGLLFRPANLIAGLMVLGYLVSWLGLDPTQREAVANVRLAISASLIDTTRSSALALSYSAIAVVIWVLLRRIGLSAQTNALGFALVLGCVVVAWMQQRWFSHHTFPIIMAFGAWWWLARPVLPQMAYPFIAFALVVPVQVQFADTAFDQAQSKEPLAPLRAANISFEGKRVALLTQHPAPFSSVILTEGGLRWTPNANITYVSNYLAPLDTPDRDGEFAPAVNFAETPAAELHRQNLDLWANYPPDFLILDHSRQWPLLNIRVRWEILFAEDADFQAIFDDYEVIMQHEDRLTGFKVYARKN